MHELQLRTLLPSTKRSQRIITANAKDTHSRCFISGDSPAAFPWTTDSCDKSLSRIQNPHPHNLCLPTCFRTPLAIVSVHSGDCRSWARALPPTAGVDHWSCLCGSVMQQGVQLVNVASKKESHKLSEIALSCNFLISDFQYGVVTSFLEGSWVDKVYVDSCITFGFIRVLDGGRWVIVGCYNGSQYKKGWKPLV